MGNYLVGIDNGGTIIKAAIFDLLGREVACSSRKTELIVPEPGHIERDMETLWEMNCQAVKEAIEKSGIDPSEIIGAAVTGHGNGLYLVGDDGMPLGRGILSADVRAQSYVDRWVSDGTQQAVLPKTCQTLWAGQPVAILSWLSNNNPKSLDRVKWIFMCKDYIRYRLTGEAWAELTDYSGTNMMNVHTLDYDSSVLEAFGLSRIKEFLPEVKGPTELCGYVTREASHRTGIVEGTPVYGGLFDIDASAIGVGITDETQLCLVAGTWSINEFISSRPIASEDLFMCSAYCIPDTWLITEGSPTSASNLEWYAEHCLPICGNAANPFKVCDEMVENTSPEASDVVFLPFLYGSNVGPEASSGFLQMKGWHRTEHLVRAVFEGIVFSHMTHLDRLKLHHSGITTARIAGGAAKSKVWVQMFADILQVPIEVPENQELGALGAAMTAGVGAGEFASLIEASELMVRISTTYYPNRSLQDVYRRKYSRYGEAVAALREFWKA